MISGKDKVTAHLEKNIISNIIQTARASLKEPSRPFTPGDNARTLFLNSEVTRPTSSYSIKSFSKDLEPLKQRIGMIDVPILTNRKVMTEESKFASRVPIKVIQEPVEEKSDTEETFAEIKDLVCVLERIRHDSEACNQFDSNELDLLLENITDALAELKYIENKPH